MRLLNDTPFTFTPIVHKVHPGRITATLVVKGTFRLVPDGPAEAAEEQRFADGDVFDDDDDTRGLRYASDLVPWKPQADLLLVGSCHAPGVKRARRCPVVFGVGNKRRTLTAFGDRYWKRKLGMLRKTDPEPFRTMPLGTQS